MPVQTPGRAKMLFQLGIREGTIRGHKNARWGCLKDVIQSWEAESSEEGGRRKEEGRRQKAEERERETSKSQNPRDRPRLHLWQSLC